MLVGYARVSTAEQNLDRQIMALTNSGVDRRNIYQEQASGTKERPQLKRLLQELQPGDVVVIADLTRISRSTKDLLDAVDAIKAKGAFIKSFKDVWLDTTEQNPYNAFLLTVMAALSQLERDLISTRTREGLAAARARGRNAGRPSKQDDKNAAAVHRLLTDGYTIKEICAFTGLSRSTVYRIKQGRELKP